MMGGIGTNFCSDRPADIRGCAHRDKAHQPNKEEDDNPLQRPYDPFDKFALYNRLIVMRHIMFLFASQLSAIVAGLYLFGKLIGSQADKQYATGMRLAI